METSEPCLIVRSLSPTQTTQLPSNWLDTLAQLARSKPILTRWVYNWTFLSNKLQSSCWLILAWNEVTAHLVQTTCKVGPFQGPRVFRLSRVAASETCSKPEFTRMLECLTSQVIFGLETDFSNCKSSKPIPCFANDMLHDFSAATCYELSLEAILMHQLNGFHRAFLDLAVPSSGCDPTPGFQPPTLAALRHCFTGEMRHQLVTAGDRGLLSGSQSGHPRSWQHISAFKKSLKWWARKWTQDWSHRTSCWSLAFIGTICSMLETQSSTNASCSMWSLTLTAQKKSPIGAPKHWRDSDPSGSPSILYMLWEFSQLMAWSERQQWVQ